MACCCFGVLGTPVFLQCRSNESDYIRLCVVSNVPLPLVDGHYTQDGLNQQESLSEDYAGADQVSITLGLATPTRCVINIADTE